MPNPAALIAENSEKTPVKAAPTHLSMGLTGARTILPLSCIDRGGQQRSRSTRLAARPRQRRDARASRIPREKTTWACRAPSGSAAAPPLDPRAPVATASCPAGTPLTLNIIIFILATVAYTQGILGRYQADSSVTSRPSSHAVLTQLRRGDGSRCQPRAPGKESTDGGLLIALAQ